VIGAENATGHAWQDMVRALRPNIGRRVANHADQDDLIQDALQAMRCDQAARQLSIARAATKSRVLPGRKLSREARANCCQLEIGTTGRVLDCMPPGGGQCGPSFPIVVDVVKDAATLARRKR